MSRTLGSPPGRDGGAGVLERLARRGPPLAAGERCEFCASPLGEHHGHVVDLDARGLLCACRPCYLLFTPRGAGHGQFRAVPERLVDLRSDAFGSRWEQLDIPVSVAFFFENSVIGRIVALYPGPGGATESELELSAWSALVDAVPGLAALAPDVEAVIVRTARDSSAVDAYLVPIDRCYELTGRLRTVWQGIDGGADARDVLDDFFADIARRARPVEDFR